MDRIAATSIGWTVARPNRGFTSNNSRPPDPPPGAVAGVGSIDRSVPVARNVRRRASFFQSTR